MDEIDEILDDFGATQQQQQGEGEGYEDTFAEVNRRLSDAHLHASDTHTRTRTDTRTDTDTDTGIQQLQELELEYSGDHDDPGEHEHEYEHEQEERYEEDEEDEEEEEETDDEEDEYAHEHDQEHDQDQEPSAAAQEKVSTVEDGRAHVYENKFTKPVLKVGNTTVSVGEARLFGLLDKDGKVKLDGKKGMQCVRTKAEEKVAIDSLVKKKDASQVKPEAEDEDAKECRFQPQRSKQATRAMRNPSCGYDFVSRLEEKGGFMDRNGGHPAPKADDRSESAKEDYEASLDKLQCPKCRKYQSFDEYIEKRRSCGPCQVRYEKLNVANMGSWKQRQAQAELKKLERLKKIEEDFYGDASFAPKLNKKSGKANPGMSLTERTEKLMEKQKAEAQEAKAQKERERLAFEEKQRIQAAAARANRAAAKKQELAKLKEGNGAESKKTGGSMAAKHTSESKSNGASASRGSSREASREGSRGESKRSGRLNQTAPASGLPHTDSAASKHKSMAKHKHKHTNTNKHTHTNTNTHTGSGSGPAAAASFHKTSNNISAKFDLLLN